jgi:hypothetical protein
LNSFKGKPLPKTKEIKEQYEFLYAFVLLFFFLDSPFRQRLEFSQSRNMPIGLRGPA